MIKQHPRVLHIVDSLTPGGAERVCVLLAKGFKEKGGFSSICATRKGGNLENEIPGSLPIIVLNKKCFFDIYSVYKLIKFIKKNNITILHAHSSSIFTAVLTKPFTDCKLFWHDHFGLSEKVDALRNPTLYRFIRPYIDGIIAVNSLLESWAINRLGAPKSKVSLVHNFSDPPHAPAQSTPTKTGKVIVCIANLRPQKDHLTLLKAFEQINDNTTQLWCVGLDNNDEHSKAISAFHNQMKKKDNVYFLGSRQDISHILKQADVGVLSSTSEGLPLTLLEYAQAQLTTVCTDVGQCSTVIQNNITGFLTSPSQPDSLSLTLQKALDESERGDLGHALKNLALLEFSKAAALEKIEKLYLEE